MIFLKQINELNYTVLKKKYNIYILYLIYILNVKLSKKINKNNHKNIFF